MNPTSPPASSPHASPGKAPDGGIVHLIEDDAALAEALCFLLESRRIAVCHHPNAEAFLEVLCASASCGEREPATPRPGCILLDVRLDAGGQAMSGLELFDKLRDERLAEDWPVVFLSGHADIRMAVDAVKRGAFDFFEKPFSDNRLVDRLIDALLESARRLDATRGAAGVEARLERLSAREREVMQGVLAGKANKVIALELGISMRTVEVHRSNLFAKMEVRSAVELARLGGLMQP